MKYQFFLIFIVLILSGCGDKVSAQIFSEISEKCGVAEIGRQLIKGGSEIHRGAYPWNAALIEDKSGDNFCGGVLISNKKVLTAAHCLKSKDHNFSVQNFSILLGMHDLSKGYEVGKVNYRAKNIFIHPDWAQNPDSFDADIAILELEKEIQFNEFIKPICLASYDSMKSPIIHGIVTGFGITEFNSSSNISRRIDFPIIDFHECAAKGHEDFKVLLTSRMFCGGHRNGNSSVCEGDSGAAVIFLYKKRYYLRGIVSFMIPDEMFNCNSFEYQAFTDVFKFHYWIQTGNIEENVILNSTTTNDSNRIFKKPSSCGKVYSKHNSRRNSVANGFFPWMAALIENHKKICDGSLISNDIVIIAAECLKPKYVNDVEFNINDYYVLLGAKNLASRFETGRIVAYIKSVHIHPDWDTNLLTFDADIALLVLKQTVQFSVNIQPVCLAEPLSEAANSSNGMLIRYEKYQNSIIPRIYPLNDINKCSLINNYYKDEIQELSSYRSVCSTMPDMSENVGSEIYVLQNQKYYLKGIFAVGLLKPYDFYDKMQFESVVTDVSKFYNWILSGGNFDSQIPNHYEYTNDKYFSKINKQMNCGKTNTKFFSRNLDRSINENEYPWNAALVFNEGGQFCGGTLISSKNVLTAAHCMQHKGVYVPMAEGDFKVLLGVHNLTKTHEVGRITVAVKKIRIHQDWNVFVSSFDADIALLELDREVIFDKYIRPICLVEPMTFVSTIQRGTVVGFGRKDNEELSNIARKLDIPMVGYHHCSVSEYLKDLISPRTLCGGEANGSGVCDGDSGSGVYVFYRGTYYLRAIVSLSLTDEMTGCNVNSESIFTDIAEFIPWIKSGGLNKYDNSYANALMENENLRLMVQRLQQQLAASNNVHSSQYDYNANNQMH